MGETVVAVLGGVSVGRGEMLSAGGMTGVAVSIGEVMAVEVMGDGVLPSGEVTGVQSVSARHNPMKTGSMVLDMRPIIASLSKPDILPETEIPLRSIARYEIADDEQTDFSPPIGGREHPRDPFARQRESCALV